MTTTSDAPQTEAAPDTDPFSRVLDNLDANFGVAPRRRAAHAKGVVVTGFFSPTPEASRLTRAGHLTGTRTPVVARFSSFPGGADHPDTAPEANPRGLAVQFRLGNGATTDLLAHSINGFPGRIIEDFADFLAAIAPGGPGPEGYLATHPAAAAFVQAIQGHGVPASFATLSYWPVNAFRFQAPDGTESVGRYVWVPVAGQKLLDDEGVAASGADFLAEELAARLSTGTVSFVLELQIAEPGDVTDDANAQWPLTRRRAELGTLHLTDLVVDSVYAEQGLFFDPVRLVDGITLSDDPLLVGRTRTYPLSLARRHTGD
jgi:catalase